MNVFCFMVLFFTILVFSQPGHAEYKKLTADWEKWTPPINTVREPSGKANETSQKQRTTQIKSPDTMPSGHGIWKTRITGLLDQSRFILPLDVSGSKEFKTVQKAKAAIGSTLRLEDLERILTARNPDVLSAYAAFQAELDGFDQVADLDAVLIRYTAFTRGVMTGVGPMKGTPDMARSHPFPGRSSLKARVVIENAAMAAFNFNITVRDNITAVRKAYWNLKLIDEKLDIFKETLGLFQHLHNIADTRYKTGETSYQDIVHISIKHKILEKEIVSLTENRQTLQTQILSLLDLPMDTILGLPGTRFPELTIPGAGSLMEQALEKRQEIGRLDHEITKMELMIEMTESMVLPSLDMGLSKNRISHIDTTGTWSTKEAFPDQGPPAAVGAGQPRRPWYGTAGSWLAQTRKKLAAKRHSRQDLESRTRALVQSAWYHLDDAARTYHLYKGSILDLSASALNVSTKEYQSGSVSFAQTAEAYSNWLNARLSFVTAKRDIGINRAELQKTVGFSF